jgi:hypothetical protein
MCNYHKLRRAEKSVEECKCVTITTEMKREESRGVQMCTITN